MGDIAIIGTANKHNMIYIAYIITYTYYIKLMQCNHLNKTKSLCIHLMNISPDDPQVFTRSYIEISHVHLSVLPFDMLSHYNTVG